MAKSNDVEDDTLDYWLTTTALGSLNISTRPIAWWIALYTSDPTDADTGDEVDATTDDTEYVRITVDFGSASAGSSKNTSVVTFPACAYGSNAVAYDVTHVAIFDAVTAGNMLYHSALTTTKTVETGEQVNFGVNDLTITES